MDDDPGLFFLVIDLGLGSGWIAHQSGPLPWTHALSRWVCSLQAPMGPVDWNLERKQRDSTQKLASRQPGSPGWPGLGMTRASQNQSTLWRTRGKGNQHTDALEEDAGRPDDLTDARPV